MIMSRESYNDIGLDWIMDQIKVSGYYGRKHKESVLPYSSEELTSLIIEYDMIDDFIRFLKDSSLGKILKIKNCFKNLKNIDGYLELVNSNVILETTDIFALKEFLRYLIELEELLYEYCNESHELELENFEDLWLLLNPEESVESTFLIYDIYSEKLKKYRDEKRAIQDIIKIESLNKTKEIKEKYGLDLFINGEVKVGKKDKTLIEKLEKSNDFIMCKENYMFYSFLLKKSEEVNSYIEEMENLETLIIMEEKIVRENITNRIREYVDQFYDVIVKIGYLDYILGKTEFIKNNNCVRPSLSSSKNIRIDDGINLKLKELLRIDNKKITPISIDISEGVTLITGANMGGKTLSLKTIGLLTMMAQMGIYVPAKNFEYYPVDFILTSIGDKQSEEKGLSSFGAEMKLISEGLKLADKNGLFLFDELASGTNPTEGFAITKSIMEFLGNKSSKFVLTSHYDGLENEGYINHYEVVGLRNIDFNSIDRNVVLHELMDYSLIKGFSDNSHSMEALNIALFMGMENKIVLRARDIVNKEGKN